MAESQIGKVLFLVGQIDGKLDSVGDKLSKINGSIIDHEKRLTVIETTEATEERVISGFEIRHQRARTAIFLMVGVFLAGMEAYFHWLY